MKSALIISGNLVQDHEFIYPYYRLLEEKFTVTVCLLGGQPVEGILGTKIPPNKDQKIIYQHHYFYSWCQRNLRYF